LGMCEIEECVKQKQQNLVLFMLWESLYRMDVFVFTV